MISWIRLFNYGIGIHLLQSEDPGSLPEKGEINPKDNHISFQVSSVVTATPLGSLCLSLTHTQNSLSLRHSRTPATTMAQ
jgi:hypothetical protein